MKKILFVTGGLGRGGAQRVISLLADEYVKAGWTVHMAMLLENKVGYQINPEFVLHDLVRKGSYAKNVVGWLRDLRKLMQVEHPNVVLAFVGRINILTMLASCGLGIPIAVSERNDPAHDRRSSLEIKLCRYFYGKADLVVFQTNYQKAFYGKRCEHNGVIIGNPIAADIYDGEHPNKDIISVGKLMSQKNHPMLIRAFAKIADQYPEKRVHIFGSGGLKTELQSLIDQLGMNGRIILEGNSDRMIELLREYQYFVMTSDYEGLSNALLEAMMSGMTCISTAWGGVEDVIIDGVNGYLVPVGDVDELSRKITMVMEHDHTAKDQEGIATAAAYKTERIIQKWFGALDKIISLNGEQL